MTDDVTPQPPAATPAPRRRATEGPPLREYLDELVLVFVIVMFIKLFIVELYKIPSGSMTPTLLGGLVAYVDDDGDGLKDLLYWEEISQPARLFLRRDGRYVAGGTRNLPAARVNEWLREGRIRNQSDRILVSKLAYWLHPPRRGEIVIFKVPPEIFKPEAPIYVKRLVGEPGERLGFTREGRLAVDGQIVEQPGFFRTQHYRPLIEPHTPGFYTRPEIRYRPADGGRWLRLEWIDVPPDEFYVFGDNTEGSLDSRYWGGVPTANFKGRAFMRILPLRSFGFLN